MKYVLVLVLVCTTLASIVFIESCVHDPITPPVIDTTNHTGCDPDSVYFQNDILPLLQSGCAKAGCHNATSREHGVVMDTYKNIMQTGDVDAGSPTKSKLYKVLKSSGEELMPPKSSGGPFSKTQINLIYKWIEQGARNNTCNSNTCDTNAVSYSAHVTPILSTYCYGCHSNNLASGGINLEGYSNAKSNVDKKRILGSIRHKSGFVAMPQGGNKLSDCQLRTISIWIENGAPNN